MSKELIIRKCKSCGAIVNVLEECNCKCGIQCCGEEMEKLVPNSVDAAVEKHVPTYEKEQDEICVKVNHVMEDEHYIEWVCFVTENRQCMVKFKPGEKSEARFPYVKGSVVYSYCNKHGLWKKEVE